PVLLAVLAFVGSRKIQGKLSAPKRPTREFLHERCDINFLGRGPNPVLVQVSDLTPMAASVTAKRKTRNGIVSSCSEEISESLRPLAIVVLNLSRFIAIPPPLSA